MFKSAPKSFVIWFILATILPIFAIVGFNVIIDPYDIFDLITIKKINEFKPQVAHNLRMAKSHVVHSIKPDVVILGTSRAELSLNPEHPGFAAHGLQKPYNMAMAGSGIYEIYQNLKHAYYASGKRLKVVVIGLDMLMFNMGREKVVFGTEVFGYDEKRLMTSNKSSYLNSLKLDFDNIFLFKATRASLNTIKQQDSEEIYLRNGMRHPIKNMCNMGMPKLGHRNAFITNEKYYMNNIWTAGSEQRYCLYCNDTNNSTMDTFANILRFAIKNNIELKLFISPAHARKLIALREAGLWLAVEEFKNGLVNAIQTVSDEQPLHKPPILWDFMTINTVTTEAVPNMADINARMWGYWEISHYKESVGNIVLDLVLDYRFADRNIPEDFGVKLSKNNLQDELDKLYSNSIAYINSFPEYHEEIRQAADKTFKTRQGTFCTPSYRLFYKANLTREAGNEALAIEELNKSLALLQEEKLHSIKRGLPFREDGLEQLIQLALSGHKMEKALPSWMAYQDRANIKIKDGDSKGAILDLTEAIHRGPENSALLYLRAIEKAKINDHIGAIEDFKHILAIDPSNVAVPQLIKQSELALSSTQR